MKLKVCGMRDYDNIQDVASCYPDFMGFIFYKNSQRFVGNDFVIPDISSSIKRVGVFVENILNFSFSSENAVKMKILNTVKKYKLDFVQLHGNETPAFCKALSEDVKLIKAFRVDAAFNFSELSTYSDFCEYFLFDSNSNLYGGSGKAFDRKLLSNYSLTKPFFLSGGISNVEVVSPYQIAIDVNSRFEIEPGLKDINKIKQLKNELSGQQ